MYLVENILGIPGIHLMADSSKFADFTEKAKQNIEQIKIGLLRHDKNPQDREFLNDISKSIQSIRKAAIPDGEI